MNFKTTLIMALIFAVGVASVLLINKSDEQKEEQKEQAAKLLLVEPDSIDQIILQPGGIELEKTGSQWVINAPVETDANHENVKSLTDMFSWIKMERTISSDPSQYAQFGLHPDRGQMIIRHSGQMDTLFLGDKSPTGEFVFAKCSGNPNVVLTSTTLETNINKTLFDLRETKVLPFAVNEIKQMDIVNNGTTISLVKSGHDWALKEPMEWPADAAAVSEITNRLSSEKAKEFIDEGPSSIAKYGLARPQNRIDLYLGESKAKKSLIIGKRSNELYYAKDETRKPVFTVDSAFVNKLNVTADQLRYKKIAEYTTNDVNKVELKYNDLNLVCVKDTAETWLIASENNALAKTWKISAMIRAITSLTIEEFVNDHPSSLARYGLNKPQIECKLYRDDILLLTHLMVGNETGDNQYFKLADKESVFLCEKSKFDSLKPVLEDLLEEVPEVSEAEQP